jgi:hypothetical protein
LLQIEGAFIQGMGLYTIEELNYSPQGVLYTRGPNQYKIPAICDIPTEMHISFLPPSENSNTLYSSKVSYASVNKCMFIWYLWGREGYICLLVVQYIYQDCRRKTLIKHLNYKVI